MKNNWWGRGRTDRNSKQELGVLVVVKVMFY